LIGQKHLPARKSSIEVEQAQTALLLLLLRRCSQFEAARWHEGAQRRPR
jgi:hypothetical protein